MEQKVLLGILFVAIFLLLIFNWSTRSVPNNVANFPNIDSVNIDSIIADTTLIDGVRVDTVLDSL